MYIGIDNSGKIEGVNLNKKQRDEVNKIYSQLQGIRPSIIPSMIDVDTHFVYDIELNKISDLCIVQIHINKYKRDPLEIIHNTGSCFYIIRKTVYLKKGSECPELKKEVVEEETRKVLISLLSDVENKLIKNPDDYSLLRRKRDIALEMQDKKLIDEVYDQIKTFKPNNSNIDLKRVSDHKNIGDLDGALSIICEKLNLDQSNYEYLKLQGEILSLVDRRNEAVQSYEDALNNNPDDYTILTRIGIIFRELGKYKESLKFLNYALSKAPNYRAAKYEKKKTYSKMFQGGIEINKTY
ncbi:MAG: hypothetical protein ACKO11_07410 [Cuspidothrix sp.]